MSARESFDKTPAYTQLATAGWLLAGILPQLYRGPDHVLYLRLQGFGEIARRFYYRDITGLRCVTTRRGQVYSAVLLLLAALPWSALLAASPTWPGAYYLAGLVSGAAGVGLLVNLAMGPTCDAWLHTANHTERLLALRRYRKARRVFAQLHAAITAAQGPLDTGDAPETVVPFSPVSEHRAARSGLPSAGRRRVLTVVFSISLLLAVSFVFDFWVNLEWKNGLDTLSVVVMALLAPAAFIREEGARCPGRVRIAAGVLVANTATIVPQYFLIMLLVAVLDPGGLPHNLDKLTSPELLGLDDGAVYFVFHGYLALSIVVLAGCGLAGLRGLRRPDSGAANPL